MIVQVREKNEETSPEMCVPDSPRGLDVKIFGLSFAADVVISCGRIVIGWALGRGLGGDLLGGEPDWKVQSE